MKSSRIIFLLGLVGSFLTFSQAWANPHFFLQMENRSDKNVMVSFQQGAGNIYLKPFLPDHTPMAAHQVSERYGIYIEPLDRNSTFNIIFTGQHDCTFNVAFFAPGRPKITTFGLGCYSVGYEMADNGGTLLLYVSDIKATQT